MPRIGEGENSGEREILRPRLERPFEKGVRINGAGFEVRRSVKTPDGKGVKIVENPEVTVGWPDVLEDED